MRTFQLIALTPPGLVDSSIAIAASRAGELGIIDLEYVCDEEAALAAVTKLARYAINTCGIKVSAESEKLLARVVSDLPKQVEVVILTFTSHECLLKQVRSMHQRGLTVLLEATSLEQALLGLELEVDGLIAKGNEAGGWVGEETTFILLQQLLTNVSLPVYAHGGIGLHTAAACYAAGAAGVVLDAQLALTRESFLSQDAKAIISRMDGSETVCLGDEIGAPCRMYIRPGLPIIETFRELEMKLTKDSRPRPEILETWRQEVKRRVGCGSPEQHLWLLGQDAAFAGSLAKRFRTVGGVLEGMRQAIDEHVRTARACKPLDESAPLARSHGTRYPIVQGPMSRVSDQPSFALKVAEGGALPFLGLGVMRAPELKSLLKETCHLMGERPFGVGILGFVPDELYQEQLKLIRAYRPPFALIAGGRPDQARILEQEGIHTYLHVPSPGLLKMFFENGARRFIFEGRECGGHVGPRSSFTLWNQTIDVLLESLSEEDMGESHVLFAGGIHDALSSSMVAAMAAPLSERGLRVGVLMGTAYLFTEEAVATGALVKAFQQEAIKCQRTELLESGPGHAVRSATSPYTDNFKREKRRLTREGKSAEEIRTELEDMNLGRLRLASKGVSRNPQYGKGPLAPKFITAEEQEQHTQGMYMIGQVAVLRDQIYTVENLHSQVSVDSTRRLENLEKPSLSRRFINSEERPSDIAIIGMACLLPKAPNLQTYWENILNKVDAIIEVPEERWDHRLYYDPDPRARDRVYSKWGGFLDAIPFDPMRYGMPPNSLPSIEPLQLLTLETVRAALKDAGYDERSFPREKTSVIIGTGGGVADLGELYSFRSRLPQYFKEVPEEVLSQLPEWTEDSFPGILNNVVAGRVANRFDLGGVNYTVDAACASSLAAVYAAVRELESGDSDMVIVGGADTAQSPFAYLCFSKTMAFSPKGRCRTFDESADGTTIGEGLAILVLKRLADAVRDGDRIYAVIKAIGASSDGYDKGITVPRLEGQARALERAYTKAGVLPSTIGLIEAHGTGTVVGDRAEIETLRQVFEKDDWTKQRCALGSVKSMIGHSKCAAGAAGLIKVALALHNKVLPPTIGVENPNSSLAGSPFYANTETRPWISGINEHPRRAGVNAFGFGGTNFHAVLEEYTDDFLESGQQMVFESWPSELFIWTGQSRKDLLANMESMTEALEQGARPLLRDLSYTLWHRTGDVQSGLKLAVVAVSLEDLQQKLVAAREALAKPENTAIHDPRGIYYTEETFFSRGQADQPGKDGRNGKDGKVAFLFSGQGSQYPNMVRDLAVHFGEVRESFEVAERVLADRFPEPLTSYIFPQPWFSKKEEEKCGQTLSQTNITQPAVGATGMGLFRLLRKFMINPDMVAGHSYGEYVALCAAGVFSDQALYAISEARGRIMMEAGEQGLGTMAAVQASRDTTVEITDSIEKVWASNLNAPEQTVISGTHEGVAEAVKILKAKGIRTTPVAVSSAFHSRLMVPVQERFGEFLSTIDFLMPKLEVFSNTHAAPYPQEPEGIVSLLIEHFARPVEFIKEIEAMYDSGARIFIEVGPRNILINLTRQILNERPHLTVALDIPGRPGLTQLQHALGQLLVHGVSLQADPLYQGRNVHLLNLDNIAKETGELSYNRTTWMVNGAKAFPLRKTSDKKPMHRFPKEQKTTHVQLTKSKTPPSEPVVPVQEQPPGAVSSPSVPEGETDRTMVQYQQMMNRFLEVQHQVMMAYLTGSTPDGTALSAKFPETAKSFDGLMPPHTAPTPAKDAIAQSMPSPEAILSEPAPLVTPVSVSTGFPEDESTQVQAEASSLVERLPIREEVTERLLKIVSDRTGYPTEELDMDLDLEADLGIDSIKRVEILSVLQQDYTPLTQQAQQDMDELMKIKTLRDIIDWFSQTLQSQPEDQTLLDVSAKQERTSGQTFEEESMHGSATELSRFLLAVNDVSITDRPLQIESGSVFIITDDEGGVAQALADELKRLGGTTILLRMRTEVGKADQNIYTVNLRDPDAVEELMKDIRQKLGSITGIIHLLPLKPGIPIEKMNMKDWQNRHRLEVKSLFYLARSACQDLIQADGHRASYLIAATAMGGSFAIESDRPELFFPGHGGIVGIVKTLAVEWPNVTCKAIDFDPSHTAATIADQLLGEMAAGDGEVEVGYKDFRRLVLKLAPVPLLRDRTAFLSIDSDWVVIVTGGARGITAEVALELAERYSPTLLLVGRSPLVEAEESPETAGLTSQQEIKAALMNQKRRKGEEFTLAQIEVQYKQLCREREMRSNLAAMQHAGSTVKYYSVNVCDEQAFGKLIEEVYRSYGRLDGVIHGAGIIDDKLVESKLPESFDRVFDTKVDSAFLLASKLKADSLRFLVFFSSVAGRFGNRGQSDYVAANEVLNKLAVYLDGQWPGRVVSINWGPWAKAGMVSDEVLRQFSQRGVQLIEPAAGRFMFDRELSLGLKGEVEVSIGKIRHEGKEARFLQLDRTTLPFLSGVFSEAEETEGMELVRTLDVSHDLFLSDHLLEGNPVFPMAMAAEMMAEVAQRVLPEQEVISIRSLQVLKGIVLNERTHKISIAARPRVLSSKEKGLLEVDTKIIEPERPDHPCYRAIIKMGRKLPEQPLYHHKILSELRSFPLTVAEAYERWLFQGPFFQGISVIDGINDYGICGRLVPSSPAQAFAKGGQGQWLIDPVLLDSGLQLAILWERVFYDMTPLPARFSCYHRFGSPPTSPVQCYVHTKPSLEGHILKADIYYVDTSGRVIGMLEEMESSCTKALNRLTGPPKSVKGSN